LLGHRGATARIQKKFSASGTADFDDTSVHWFPRVIGYDYPGNKEFSAGETTVSVLLSGSRGISFTIFRMAHLEIGCDHV
jgi:hypothetical protein